MPGMKPSENKNYTRVEFRLLACLVPWTVKDKVTVVHLHGFDGGVVRSRIAWTTSGFYQWSGKLARIW
jgi:hypothetical protein